MPLASSKHEVSGSVAGFWLDIRETEENTWASMQWLVEWLRCCRFWPYAQTTVKRNFCQTMLRQSVIAEDHEYMTVRGVAACVT